MPSYNTIFIFKEHRDFYTISLNFINVEYDNMDKCIYFAIKAWLNYENYINYFVRKYSSAHDQTWSKPFG